MTMNLTDSQVQSLNKLQQLVQDGWNPIHNPFPNILYHYTSASGLIGILTSKSIWATDLRYMNDMSELQYCKQLVEECIASEDTSTLTEIQKEFLKRISRTYDPFEFGASVYSTSFCENGNLLSQWRAYRGQGGGYAIGFDFFHALRMLNKPCVLRRVIYERVKQVELLKQSLQMFLKTLKTTTEGMIIEDVTNDFLPTLCQTYSNVIGEYLFCFKHPDFHEEKEWRLVHYSRHVSPVNREIPIPSFREYQGNVIPYYAISFSTAIEAACDDLSGIGFPIPNIVIGPTVNGELNRQSLSTLLFSLCKDIEPKIIKSEIPLRWL